MLFSNYVRDNTVLAVVAVLAPVAIHIPLIVAYVFLYEERSNRLQGRHGAESRLRRDY